MMADGLFTYAGLTHVPPTSGISFGESCPIYVCYDGGVSGLTLHPRINGTDFPSVMFNEPATSGYVNVDGLYYLSHSSPFGVNILPYEIMDGTTVVAAVNLYFDEPEVGYCPVITPSPAPVLTVTPVYNPAPGYNDMEMEWTASASADAHFWSIEYQPQRDGLMLTTMHDSPLTWTDPNVAVGGSYSYRVRAAEPVIGGAVFSNLVNFDDLAEVPPPGGVREAWGVLAR